MDAIQPYTVCERVENWDDEDTSIPFARVNLDPKYRWLKRGMDLLIAIPGMLCLAPIFLLIWLAVKLTSPGPAFFAWNVVGRGGRPFRSYKFRTMVKDADRIKAQLMDRNEMTGPVFKLHDDPRVTPLGKVLRKFSLDELPQIWSVIKGDMSLVGPRPVLAYEWEQFDDWQRRKLGAKPGAVSLWHVKGHPTDLDEWVKLDLEYIENWSLWLDIKILGAAAGYILAGRNC